MYLLICYIMEWLIVIFQQLAKAALPYAIYDINQNNR